MGKTIKAPPNDVGELLKTLLIIQLGLAGVSHQSIRAIVGCNMNRVTAVMKHVRQQKRPKKENP